MRVELNNRYYQNSLINPKNSDVNVLQLKNIDLNNNPLSNLNKANINFCAMKMNQFSGIDKVMVKKLKFNVQKINVAEDFQNFCKNILDTDIIKKVDVLAKSTDPQAQEQKKAILNDWINYIVKENDGYNYAIKLFILSSIIKNLSEDTNHLPPILDKRKVTDTIQEITERLKTDKGFEPNFDKTYRKNLTQTVLETEKNLDTNLNGWIIIPSKSNAPEHFEENVKKLQTLSHDSWCTKTYNAEPYLAKGDFHIYMENGKPKLGVRFDGEEIQEIQGKLNNSKIPLAYLDIAKSHVEDNKYKTNYKTDEEFKVGKKIKQEIAGIKKKIGKKIKNKKYDKILSYFGFKVEKDENGMLTLSHYDQPSINYTFFDLGIDEIDMFKHIKVIKGNATFRDSRITSLGELQSIGGFADFKNSQITSLCELQSIGGFADFKNSRITSLGELQTIGGKAYFNNYKLEGGTKLLQATTNDKKFDGIKICNLKAIELKNGEIVNINQELNKTV